MGPYARLVSWVHHGVSTAHGMMVAILMSLLTAEPQFFCKCPAQTEDRCFGGGVACLIGNRHFTVDGSGVDQNALRQEEIQPHEP